MNDPNQTQSHSPDDPKASEISHAAPEPPQHIGRYRVERILGQGGYGIVYLAHDDQLKRLVAIKVPHSHLVAQASQAEAYLTEARTVANLDHPHIVPVFDVGSTDQFPCFVVSKYIDGTDLAAKLKSDRLTIHQTIELMATVTEALHHAHKQGLVHRDIKPANILLDRNDNPFVTDFGLALREQDIGKGPRFAGTPMYMSPEQARGEGHRVDGRSDIFSLGVVLYEMLTGRRPFKADSQYELLEQITTFEPRPPRQHDDVIPKELDRICLKALSKRASERYSTAKDMVDDLRSFLFESPSATKSALTSQQKNETAVVTPVPTPMETNASDSQPIKIVPKGLRSFDAHDADFFLELLPGPRDRDDLPESIRFWKNCLEETDADNTFAVGLIYGPSGCGKSSFVKAGLLPRLADSVIAVYVEATAEETETRLLNGLRKRCAALPNNLTLKETLAVLRQGQDIPLGKKVVIILDQFEQWLHAKKDEQNTELVQALRQCDGGRVQCVVMVRDDFWLAVSRFLRELEIRLLEGQNSALADLFDMDHARKVLAAFGRAFGKLPATAGGKSSEQQAFLTQAVAGLAQEGKVVSVRLALFAEMMKSKPWTPATLKEVGGTEGVGATFLEETFSATTAPPEHRYHQKAARAVLKALLPESGTDIKGHMRSYDELLEASGYATRPKDFQDLIHILDSEIRLITPTDPEGDFSQNEPKALADKGPKVVNHSEARSASASGSNENKNQKSSIRYFQLTHDYLVPSLRDWLTRKQKETRKGRAELLLADRSAVWNARPENRQLPSLLQWFQIKAFTAKNQWTSPQRKMMSRASWYQVTRGAIVMSLLIVGTFAGLAIRQQFITNRGASYATGLVGSLLKADFEQVPSIVTELKDYRQWSQPLLTTKLNASSDGSAEKLRLALALLPMDDSQVDYLKEQLPGCSLEQVPIIRAALLPHKAKLTESLWQFVQDKEQDAHQRFQIAAALAEYAPDDDRWKEIAPLVAEHLTNAISFMSLQNWQQLFKPADRQLNSFLIEIFANRNLAAEQRKHAAYLLSEYLRDQPAKLADVVVVADETAEFSLLIEALKPQAAHVKQCLLDVMYAAMPEELDKTNDQLKEEKERRLRDVHWKRQSLAAVALVQLGFGGEVWPLLKFSPNPSLQSFIIYNLGKLGTDPNTLAAQLEIESDVSIRWALIQSLGGLDVTRIPINDRSRIVEHLKALYVNDPDSGIHGSSSWALRKWGVTLLEIPKGEPVLTEEQKTRIDKLAAEVVEIRESIAASEKELPIRQAAWKQQLREQPASLPASFSEGLVAHFPLNETEGNETANRVEGQPSGVYAGQSQPEWVPGVFGNAVRLDGKGDFISGSKVPANDGGAFSFGCWFKCDDIRGTILISTEDPENGYRGIELGTYNGEFEVQISSGEAGFKNYSLSKIKVKVRVPAAFPQTYWQHLFATYDGSGKASGVELHLNGVEQVLTIVNDALQGSTDTDVPLRIGGRSPGSFRFIGAIDDVRVYNRRLSEGEFQQLYANGLRALAEVPSETRTPQQQALLSAAYRLQDKPLQQLNSQLAAAETTFRNTHSDGIRRWFVNSEGQTMVVIPSPSAFGQSTINYIFAISSHETTIAEFQRFRKEYAVDPINFTSNDCPATLVTWYGATEYCNWLSKQEGITEDQWVYSPNDSGNYDNGMKIKENYLDLTGYRLPTEAEWGYACSAGTTRLYNFGDSNVLLNRYGWYKDNSMGSSHPVEALLPNVFGLFDLHGNVSEWTQNHISGAASPVRSNVGCILCGNGFNTHSLYSGSDQRFSPTATYKFHNAGFRIARTIPAIPLAPQALRQ